MIIIQFFTKDIIKLKGEVQMKNVDVVEYYEDLYGEEPSTVRIPKGRKSSDEGSGSKGKKKNKIDKKNAVKAPWKQDNIPTTTATE